MPFSCIQSTQAGSVVFLLKHQLEGSVTQTKEGVTFQEKMTGAGGTHYLLWYWQHSSCVLCLPSVVYRVGYLSPIKTESALSLPHYLADLTLLTNTERVVSVEGESYKDSAEYSDSQGC